MHDKDTFELAFRRYNDDGGHSYDPYDINYCWKEYQKNPDTYDFLIPYFPGGSKYKKWQGKKG